MKYKDYSNDIWDQLKATVQNIRQTDEKPVAAFDADGTLWDIDLGELFFHYIIDNQLVPLPPRPWEHYQNLKAESPPKAYLWLAQILEGRTLKEIREWARKGVEGASPLPIFMPQKKVIDLFLQNGIEVYIVTASVTWAVEPGAEILGLRKDNVIGVETDVVNEIISTSQKGPITYREGKVQALLERTQGRKPFFSSGNTMGDFELLQASTQIKLAVSAASRDDRIFKTEAELQNHAEQNNWLKHRFI